MILYSGLISSLFSDQVSFKKKTLIYLVNTITTLALFPSIDVMLAKNEFLKNHFNFVLSMSSVAESGACVLILKYNYETRAVQIAGIIAGIVMSITFLIHYSKNYRERLREVEKCFNLK